MGKKKKKIAVKAHVGEQEIKLSDGLISVIHAEIISQLGGDFEEMDFELVMSFEVEKSTEDKAIDELSNFNKSLKKALNYSPKKGK